MLLNSFAFVIFFLTILTFLRLGSRYTRIGLLAASYLFYASWEPRHLPLLFLSTAVSYFSALAIEKSRAYRYVPLCVCVVVQMGILFSFKYFDLLVSSLGLFGMSLKILTQPTIPVGLSFYTFQSLGYCFDVYHKKIRAESGFIDFANFVSFFPQLLAGPIERASDLLNQVKRPQLVWPKGADLERGIYLLFLGAFFIMALGENLAQIALPFARIARARQETMGMQLPPEGIDYLLSVYAFVFSLYLRFAGYSLMAQGYALLMGVRLSANFNFPFFSSNMVEFWGRWHISLSKWIRDYIFFPLMQSAGGLAMRSKPLMFLNVLITMWFFGLWHAATIGWLVASTILASASISYHLLKGGKRSVSGGDSRVKKVLGMVITFNVFSLAMVFVNNLNAEISMAQFIDALASITQLKFWTQLTSGQVMFFECVGLTLLIDFINYKKKSVFGLLEINPILSRTFLGFLFVYFIFQMNLGQGISMYLRM